MDHDKWLERSDVFQAKMTSAEARNIIYSFPKSFGEVLEGAVDYAEGEMTHTYVVLKISPPPEPEY